MSVEEEAESSPCQARFFELRADELLPPVCPWCGAPGTTLLSLPLKEQRHRVLDVHACDLCAEAEARRRTIFLARLLSVSLCGAACATALSYFGGERYEAAQLFVVVLGTVFLGSIPVSSTPALDKKLRAFVQPPQTSQADAPTGVLLRSTSAPLNRALSEAGLAENSGATLTASVHKAAQAGLAREWAPKLLPALLATAWWLGLHYVGRATLHLVNMGPAQIVLSVDGRRTLTLPPMRFERAGLGTQVELLAGRRALQILSTTGATLFEETVHLLPGQTAVFPRLNPGYCLYAEELNYGSPAPPRFTLLSRGTELVPIEGQVDSWFVPLNSQPSAEAEPSKWLRPEGRRQAIRLLSCPKRL